MTGRSILLMLLFAPSFIDKIRADYSEPVKRGRLIQG